MDRCKSIDLLKNHGLKATKQRLILLDTILSLKDKIFTVKIIYSKLYGEMDQVTVYRILSNLNEKGIIREIFTSNDEKFYEISCIHNPVHPHFHCSKCKKITCLPASKKEKVESIREEYNDLIITDTLLNFSGICKLCSK